MPDAILILGGTAEANALATTIAARAPLLRLVLSLAGRTASPRLPEGVETRVGGFGGVDGLAAYLTTERVSHLVDATHPFAMGISRNAAKAARLAGTPRIAFSRPPWQRQVGDDWHSVSCLGDAAKALPVGARPFLALGRQHLATFAHRGDISPVLRMIDPPAEPLPFAARIVLGRPQPSEAEEKALLLETGATHLVCRNSGGAAGLAKLAAARALALPVVMIERSGAPEPPVADTPGAVLAFLGL